MEMIPIFLGLALLVCFGWFLITVCAARILYNNGVKDCVYVQRDQSSLFFSLLVGVLFGVVAVVILTSLLCLTLIRS